MTAHRGGDSMWRRPVLAAVLLLTVVLGSRGLTDESAVMLAGDMARYVMNGVFMHDLIADGGAWSYDDLAGYAERYYARYPALSLGHHPPLPYVALIPFFSVFGVSLFAARVAGLAWFVFATWALYTLAKRVFDWRVASWATALFVTNVMVLRSGQHVLSEIPMVALTLVAVNALLVFCETRQPRHAVWFGAAVVASLYAKQLAIFMLPVYGVILITTLGWRPFVTRRALAVAGILCLLAAPIVAMTVSLAPANVQLAMWQVSELLKGNRFVRLDAVVAGIVTSHLTMPTVLATAAAGALLIVRRHRFAAVAATWILSVVGGSAVFAGGIEPARYAFGVLPVYFLVAATLADRANAKAVRMLAVIVLTVAVAWQAWLIRSVRPSGAGGYEAAAEFVVDHSNSPVVLYDSAVDTGYFVFFVRKHDPKQQRVVLRADKVMVAGRERTGNDPGEAEAYIYSQLGEFGVQYVVVEERRGGAPMLHTLHEQLKTPEFAERLRIPIVSLDPAVRGLDLVVFEYLAARPPNLDAELNIGLPLGRRKIELRLRDLIGSGSR